MSEWPEYLMIRDTALHDDAGGLGQRIYTTAGAGYEKKKYVRADKTEATEARYNELLLAVSNKYPGETRHETALRYIRERETPNNDGACSQTAST
jgi:hypothetical protein